MPYTGEPTLASREMAAGLGLGASPSGRLAPAWMYALAFSSFSRARLAVRSCQGRTHGMSRAARLRHAR